MWHVQRDKGAETGNTGKVLVAADYELLDDAAAVELAGAILDVARGQAHYVAQDGGRYETRAEYEDQD